ncbi:hypothetical protein D9758_010033 [Tetrapyrgos nigripes]|uniref:Uncharacterized protein n=1 Tax=Tetrapyrgos nigripes TaxID=182062 RepID=A0A8H5CTZ2_9AGAR|nr:hypothetical protein D9758_010033 [Tetrapyrgos nigripes]
MFIGSWYGPIDVAGLSLSSGYTWLTNKYGFAIDNVVSYDIVLPNGTITTVTESGSDPFFTLQGRVVVVTEDLTAATEATTNYAARTQEVKAMVASIFAASNSKCNLYSAPILSWPLELIEYICDLAIEYSSQIATKTQSSAQVTGNVEPFLIDTYGHGRDSAWPHDTSGPFNTFNGLFVWTKGEAAKKFFTSTQKKF